MNKRIVLGFCLFFWSSFSLAGKYLIPPMEQSLLFFESGLLKEKLKNEFSILVWNVHKGKDGQAWVEDMKSLAHHSDIVLLQEAMNDDLMSRMYLNDLNHFDWHMAKSFTYMKTGVSTGVANASSFLIDQSMLHRTLDREPLVKTPKTVMLSYLTMENGKPLAVLNIHGLNVTTNAAFFRQIDGTLNLIENFSGPVIYAGDFNTNNKAKLEGLDLRMSNYGLKRIEYSNDPRKKKLDWIYVRGCTVESSEVLYQYKTSDHKPLIAKMSCR